MAALAPSAARLRLAALSRGLPSCSIFSSSQCSQTPSPQLSSTQTQPSSRPFSSSPALAKRKRRYQPRDNNRHRGVSSIYRSGPREFLSVSDHPLPRPVKGASLAKNASPMTVPEIDPKHGLWQFFYDKQVAQTPAKDSEFGRPWTVEELRRKSWDDLHRLWWVCVKERNRIATATEARKQFELGFGDYEAGDRDDAVRKTMQGIKHVLTERFYVWEDAVDLAKTDPEINLSGDGPAFRPSAYLEEDAEVPTEGEKEDARADAAVPESATPEEQRAPVR